MTYHFFPGNCHQRDGKRVRISQCINDELFRVVTNGKSLKSGFGDLRYRFDVLLDLIADNDVHVQLTPSFDHFQRHVCWQ